MPTRRLPGHPDLQQLKQQAKDLLRAHRDRSIQAIQRIEEFHPRYRRVSDSEIAGAHLKLADAHVTIAREYGFASWPRLKAHVENPNRENFSLPAHERLKDPLFRHAVDLLDAGDAEGLRAHLRAHPALVHHREQFEGGNYFQKPTLLEFAAENPTRRGTLPKNIVEMTRIILDAGGKDDRASLNETLGLVASSAVAHECGAQRPLIELLCAYGADPNTATHPALLYGFFDSVELLLHCGATHDLVVAAAMGNVVDAAAALPISDDETRQKALALASVHGRTEIVRMLLDAGVDPNRFAPVGGHSHATPLHQAALSGQDDVVRILVERGARTDIRDIHHGGTAFDWAVYGRRDAIAEYLREAESPIVKIQVFRERQAEGPTQ
ncbi:MAG: ankyrin repeat domain-containing protein [Vulcanimicrobiaceae bacterium]